MIHNPIEMIIVASMLFVAGVWVECQDQSPKVDGMIVWGCGFLTIGLLILVCADLTGPF